MEEREGGELRARDVAKPCENADVTWLRDYPNTSQNTLKI